MSTVAYRAALIREVEQAMRRVVHAPVTQGRDVALHDGQLDAYAQVLQLLKDKYL